MLLAAIFPWRSDGDGCASGSTATPTWGYSVDELQQENWQEELLPVRFRVRRRPLFAVAACKWQQWLRRRLRVPCEHYAAVNGTAATGADLQEQLFCSQGFGVV